MSSIVSYSLSMVISRGRGLPTAYAAARCAFCTIPSGFNELVELHERSNGDQGGRRRSLVAKISAYGELGLKPAKMIEAVQRDKRFLRSRFENVRKNLEVLHAFGFKDVHVDRFIRVAPWTLRSDTQRLRAFLSYFHQTLRLPKSGVVHLCAKEPRVASLHLEKTILPCVEYFSRELEMEPTGLVTMIEKYPRILGLSVEDRIRPVVHFFLEELKTPPTAFLRHLQAYPGVLGCSLEKSIRARAAWIQQVTSVDRRVLHYVCLRGLVLFETRSDILFRSYEALLEAFDGDEPLLARVLRRVPHILSWSPSSVIRQVSFVQERLQRNLTDLYHFPSLLGMSITDRLLPRVELMERIRIPHKHYPLFLLFRTTDSEFQQWIQETQKHPEDPNLEQERILMRDTTHFETETLQFTIPNRHQI